MLELRDWAYSQRLQLPYPISANVYWRFVNGRPLVSHEARKYKNLVQHKALVQRVEKLDGAIALRIEFFPKTKGRRMDLDNCQKIVIDALQGVAYDNDSAVVDIHTTLGEKVDGGALIVHWGVVF